MLSLPSNKLDDPTFVYLPPEKKYFPQEEDEGKAVIFFDPFCPHAVFFSKKMEEAIKEIAPDLPIRIINEYEEPEEAKKRGTVYQCIVNAMPIESFVLDKENFRKEVMRALREK